MIQNKDEEIRSYLRELTRMRTAQLSSELPSALSKQEDPNCKRKQLSEYYRSESKRRSVRRENETDASSPRPFTGEEEARPRHFTGRGTLLTSLETA